MSDNVTVDTPDQGGRPTKYEPRYNKQAQKLCILGATDEDLAEFFEVNERTINEWKEKYKRFSQSIKKGKVLADINVADSLYKRAIGFSFKEVTFEKIDGKVNLEVTKDEIITTDAYRKKIVTKEMAPDVTAQIFWLKNRSKKNWRDKFEVDHTTKGDKISGFDLSKYTDEELSFIAELQRKGRAGETESN